MTTSSSASKTSAADNGVHRVRGVKIISHYKPNAPTLAKKLSPITTSPWKLCQLPQSDRLLERPRIVTIFEKYLGKSEQIGRVFTVTAPAGSGKTTAMTQWAEYTTVPVCWYHIDVSDEDPVVFIEGLVQALRGTSSRVRWEVEYLFQHLHASTPSPTDLQRAVATLASDIRHYIKKPLALLLTDVSSLSANSVVYELLGQLIAREPDYLRMVIETREPLPFDSPTSLTTTELLTQNRIKGIGQAELELTDDEFVELLSILDFQDTPEKIEELRTLCSGWLTGVLLGTGGLLPDGSQAISSEETDRQRIFDYLTLQVIDRLPAHLSAFAMESAVLPVMTSTLCEQLAHCPDAHNYLVALEHQNIFTKRLGRRPSKAFYQFQPFFRQALLQRLEAQKGNAYRRQLQERAGELLELGGDFPQAAHQYAEAGCYERVIALIEEQCEAMRRVGKAATLAQWIGLLPERIIAATPHLRILLAEIRYQEGNSEVAITLIDGLSGQLQWSDSTTDVAAAPAQSSPGNNQSHLLARILMLQSSIAFYQGDYHTAISGATKVRQLAPADEVSINAGLLRVAALHQLGETAAALAVLEEVEQHFPQVGDLWVLSRVHYHRSKILAAQGQYALAERSARAALIRAEESLEVAMIINSHLNLGEIAKCTNRFKIAREHFEIALADAEVRGCQQGRAYALANLADCDLNCGLYESAIIGYEEVLTSSIAPQDTYLRGYALANFGFSLSLRKRMVETMALIEPEISRLTAYGPMVRAALLISLGFAYFRSEIQEQAIVTLTNARQIAQEGGAAIEEIRASLHLAAALVTVERTPEANMILQQAFNKIRPADAVAALLFDVQCLSELVPLLQHMGRASHPVAQALLAELATMRATAERTVNASAETAEDASIRIHAFGEAMVFLGEKKISKWGIPRARELLYYLLDRGEPVSKETIVDALWEHEWEAWENGNDAGSSSIADAPSPLKTFKSVCHRLRRALGPDCIVQTNGRWKLNIEYWSDLREFQQLADRGEKYLTEGRLTEALHEFEQAIALRTGDYLEDFFSGWAVRRREELQEQYFDLLERMASIELRLRHSGKAAQYYRQVLKVEPLRQSAFRGLMSCLAVQGEYSSALQQFHHYRELLQQRSMQLEAKTIALYQQLRAKREQE